MTMEDRSQTESSLLSAMESIDWDWSSECEPNLTSEQIAEALEFYHGKQWRAEIKRKREEQHRPCVVANRLVEIVRTRDCEGNLEAVASIVIRNNDKQRLYNYLLSTLIEVQAV